MEAACYSDQGDRNATLNSMVAKEPVWASPNLTPDAELRCNLQRSLPYAVFPGCCEDTHSPSPPYGTHELYTNYFVPQDNGQYAPKPA